MKLIKKIILILSLLFLLILVGVITYFLAMEGLRETDDPLGTAMFIFAVGVFTGYNFISAVCICIDIYFFLYLRETDLKDVCTFHICASTLSGLTILSCAFGILLNFNTIRLTHAFFWCSVLLRIGYGICRVLNRKK